jgi:hypothetical protein
LNSIYSEAFYESPTTAPPTSTEVQRPALREIQPQAVLARTLAKEKENQGQPVKPSWQAAAPNLRQLTAESHSQALQRVLVRTEERRKLDTLEDPRTPSREQVHTELLRTPCGQGLSQRIVPMSSSTQSTWSLCNSEDSFFGSCSGIVTDLEDAVRREDCGLPETTDEEVSPLSRPRLSNGSSKAGDNGRCREAPASPSTPFFGKASANDVIDIAPPPAPEPRKSSVVTDACARVLHELRRNTSLIRLTCEEEMARRNMPARGRRTYEV